MNSKDPLYFEIQADFGITKHLGGLKATRELAELCHMEKGKSVLVVGCGIGATSCYLAERYGVKVIGVDISEGMVTRAKERARRKGLEGKVEFRTADAQKLPFKDTLFDVVVSESVIAFVNDKLKAIKEYLRVTKPGGFVGLNECLWLKTPPAELVEYLSRLMGGPEFRNSEDWQKLLKEAGLKNIEEKTCKMTLVGQFAEEIKTLEFRDFIIAWYRFLIGSLFNPSYRKFTREALRIPKSVFKFMEYMGYGLYVVRK